MKRLIILFAAFALSACAAAPAEAPPSTPWIDVALSCDAAEARQCPPGGCRPGHEGEEWPTPISLYVPARGQAGRFCIATGCEAAVITPTLTRALGYTAQVRTNDRTSQDAALEVARDLRSFTLTWADGEGVTRWAGTCQAAGS